MVTTKSLKKKKKKKEGSLRAPMPTSFFHILPERPEKEGCAIALLPSSLKGVGVGGGKWSSATDGAGAFALWQVNHLRMVVLLSLEWDIFEWFPM